MHYTTAQPVTVARPPTRIELIGQEADGGCFSCTIKSQQLQYLSALHAETDTNDGLLVLEATPEYGSFTG